MEKLDKYDVVDLGNVLEVLDLTYNYTQNREKLLANEIFRMRYAIRTYCESVLEQEIEGLSFYEVADTVIDFDIAAEKLCLLMGELEDLYHKNKVYKMRVVIGLLIFELLKFLPDKWVEMRELERRKELIKPLLKLNVKTSFEDIMEAQNKLISVIQFTVDFAGDVKDEDLAIAFVAFDLLIQLYNEVLEVIEAFLIIDDLRKKLI